MHAELPMLKAFYTTTICLSLTCAAPGEADPWDLITQISYEETETANSWSVAKTIPDELRDMAQGFEITGHYVQIEALTANRIKQFIIVPEAADCPFCGESGYGPALEVTLKRAIRPIEEGTQITLRGTLQFDESPETYRAVFLTDAKRID
jgi:hypothetical protein